MSENEELERQKLELELKIKRKELEIKEKESNTTGKVSWFQVVVAALGVVATGLLGLGQWRVSSVQNRLTAEEHVAEDRRAQASIAAEKNRADDNVEVQVMALVAPRFPELTGTDKKAITAQSIVFAAALFLSNNHSRTGLAGIYYQLLPSVPSVKPEIRAGIEEATVPAEHNAPWYAVLASLPGDNLTAAHRMANEKLKICQAKHLSSCDIQIWRTKISNNLAVVVAGKMSQSEALTLAASARDKGVAADAFAQKDRSWVKIEGAPFK